MKASAIPFALLLALLGASSALAASERDGAVIQNSGSTNASGYVIKIWSNGAASVQAASKAGVVSGDVRTASVPAALAWQFFADLRSAKAHGTAAAQSCVKSASFGSSTIVRYHRWQSGDLECPGDEQLTNDVHSIAGAVRAGGMAHSIIRRPLMPNEPRRPEPTPQATASPESV